MRCRFGLREPRLRYDLLILFGNVFGGLRLLDERQFVCGNGLFGLLCLGEQLIATVCEDLLQGRAVEQLGQVAELQVSLLQQVVTPDVFLRRAGGSQELVESLAGVGQHAY